MKLVFQPTPYFTKNPSQARNPISPKSSFLAIESCLATDSTDSTSERNKSGTKRMWSEVEESLSTDLSQKSRKTSESPPLSKRIEEEALILLNLKTKCSLEDLNSLCDDTQDVFCNHESPWFIKRDNIERLYANQNYQHFKKTFSPNPKVNAVALDFMKHSLPICHKLEENHTVYKKPETPDLPTYTIVPLRNKKGQMEIFVWGQPLKGNFPYKGSLKNGKTDAYSFLYDPTLHEFSNLKRFFSFTKYLKSLDLEKENNIFKITTKDQRKLIKYVAMKKNKSALQKTRARAIEKAKDHLVYVLPYEGQDFFEYLISPTNRDTELQRLELFLSGINDIRTKLLTHKNLFDIKLENMVVDVTQVPAQLKIIDFDDEDYFTYRSPHIRNLKSEEHLVFCYVVMIVLAFYGEEINPFKKNPHSLNFLSDDFLAEDFCNDIFLPAYYGNLKLNDLEFLLKNMTNEKRLSTPWKRAVSFC
jgi:hypothetical protein